MKTAMPLSVGVVRRFLEAFPKNAACHPVSPWKLYRELRSGETYLVISTAGLVQYTKVLTMLTDMKTLNMVLSSSLISNLLRGFKIDAGHRNVFVDRLLEEIRKGETMLTVDRDGLKRHLRIVKVLIHPPGRPDLVLRLRYRDILGGPGGRRRQVKETYVTGKIAGEDDDSVEDQEFELWSNVDPEVARRAVIREVRQEVGLRYDNDEELSDYTFSFSRAYEEQVVDGQAFMAKRVIISEFNAELREWPQNAAQKFYVTDEADGNINFFEWQEME